MKKTQRLEEMKKQALCFDKTDVRELLELIAGGEKELTIKQLNKWRDLILIAVASMRFWYEHFGHAKNHPLRVYYGEDWKEIDAAVWQCDDKKLIKALESLRGAIQWE